MQGGMQLDGRTLGWGTDAAVPPPADNSDAPPAGPGPADLIDEFALALELTQAMHWTGSALRLGYQPIIGLEDGKLLGFLATLRWFRAGQPTLSGDGLLALAESHGIGEALDFWTVQRAGLDSRLWREAVPDLFMLVRVTGALFRSALGAPALRAVLRGTGMAPRQLALHLVGEAAGTAAGLLQAGRLGVRLVAGDRPLPDAAAAGEAASLATLDSQHFLCRPADPEYEAMLRGMVGEARRRGALVVATGLADGRSATLARRVGCAAGCGPWYAETVSAEAAQAFIDRSAAFWRRA